MLRSNGKVTPFPVRRLEQRNARKDLAWADAHNLFFNHEPHEKTRKFHEIGQLEFKVIFFFHGFFRLRPPFCQNPQQCLLIFRREAVQHFSQN